MLAIFCSQLPNFVVDDVRTSEVDILFFRFLVNKKSTTIRDLGLLALDDIGIKGSLSPNCKIDDTEARG